MYLFLCVVNYTRSLLLLFLFLLFLLLLLLLLLDFSAILLTIKSPAASAIFWIALFEAVLVASVGDFLALSRSFDHTYYLNFYPYF